jgi:hypothetical protein
VNYLREILKKINKCEGGSRVVAGVPVSWVSMCVNCVVISLLPPLTGISAVVDLPDGAALRQQGAGGGGAHRRFVLWLSLCFPCV